MNQLLYLLQAASKEVAKLCMKSVSPEDPSGGFTEWEIAEAIEKAINLVKDAQEIRR